MHQPVMLKEVLEHLEPKPGEIIVDCTLGGGGHTSALAQAVGAKGKVIAFDVDEENIRRLNSIKETKGLNNIITVKANFRDLKKQLEKLKIESVDAILADLGFATDQLASIPGLSFKEAASPLDMRLDQEEELTAAALVNQADSKELERILREFGEERKSQQITDLILRRRKEKPIETVGALRDLIKKAYGGREKLGKIDVATRTFMALRIAVNTELENLKQLMKISLKVLNKKGRIAVISFHSLEDRIVKNFFRKESRKCICDPDQMQCTCDHQPVLKIITKKPVRPGEQELIDNPKARSAKLRVAEKIT